MKTEHPMHWLRQIKEEIAAYKNIPLWGSPPPFPWETYSSEMKSALECPTIRIEPKSHDFLPPNQHLQPFGSHPKIIALELSPLAGTFFWIFSAESVSKLTSLCLTKNPGSKGFSDLRFQEGFYQYLLLRAIHGFEKLQCYPNLHLHILEPQQLPQEPCFVSDVLVTVHEQSLLGRLVYSPSFQATFREHFHKDKIDILSSDVAESIDLSLSLQAGNCTLSQQEWSHVKAGDCIVLDRCSYDPDTQKGTLTLVLKNHPLFKVKIKKNNIKILDYAFYHGEKNTMDEQQNPSPTEPPAEKHELEKEAPYIESEEDFSEESDHLWETPPSEPPPSELFSAQDIPLQIVVEVDHIRMNLQKLLQLQPGNVLELSVRPEQGIYLTVSGKKIARGELIKLGDLLGVKILEIGDHKSG